jgi:hypothetical protein
MHGIHREMGLKDMLFALTLEVVFLAICTVFIGLGWTELRKKKDKMRSYALIGLGIFLACVSFYVTFLLIQG